MFWKKKRVANTTENEPSESISVSVASLDSSPPHAGGGRWYRENKNPSPKGPEELAFEEYFRWYEEAKMYQDQYDFESAAALHQRIFSKHIPTGTAYYETAATCYLSLNQRDEAVRIYNIALRNPHRFDKTTFNFIENKFPIAIKYCYQFSAAYEKILEIIKNTPGVLQKDLRNMLDVDDQIFNTLLFLLVKRGIISKEKNGRYVSLFISDSEPVLAK